MPAPKKSQPGFVMLTDEEYDALFPRPVVPQTRKRQRTQRLGYLAEPGPPTKRKKAAIQEQDAGATKKKKTTKLATAPPSPRKVPQVDATPRVPAQANAGESDHAVAVEVSQSVDLMAMVGHLYRTASGKSTVEDFLYLACRAQHQGQYPVGERNSGAYLHLSRQTT
jgi:hypothetical protein